MTNGTNQADNVLWGGYCVQDRRFHEGFYKPISDLMGCNQNTAQDALEDFANPAIKAVSEIVLECQFIYVRIPIL